jgi:hypothetical protein
MKAQIRRQAAIVRMLPVRDENGRRAYGVWKDEQVDFGRNFKGLDINFLFCRKIVKNIDSDFPFP